MKNMVACSETDVLFEVFCGENVLAWGRRFPYSTFNAGESVVAGIFRPLQEQTNLE
jgi:hypothetical protein